MAFRKWFVTGALALMVSTLAPAKASADWLFTPFIGGTFGGSAHITDIGGDVKDEFNRKLTYGGSLAYLGGGIVGFEVDFGYSPNFFGVDSNDSLNLIGDGNVTTLMGNLMLAGPKAPIRPYASGGVGLIKTSVDNPTDLFRGQQQLRLQCRRRADGLLQRQLRHPRRRPFLPGGEQQQRQQRRSDAEQLQFWRGSVGVTFRF